MVDPETGKQVEYAEIRKGYEIQPGVFVILDPGDFEVITCVPSGTINYQWYERPYFAGPADSAQDYFAFALALRNKGREALVAGSCAANSTWARFAKAAATWS